MDCPYSFKYHPELGPGCVDAEACQQGWLCDKVRKLAARKKDRMEVKQDPEAERLKAQIRDWWLDVSHAEVEAVAPKAVEYSAVDLVEYGRTLALVMGLKHSVTDEEATEIGIWGYMVGKVARWTGAIKEGRRVSDDTIHDIAVYTKMAQRNRAVGGWPTAQKED